MSAFTDEAVAALVRNDLPAIEALARRDGPDGWPADVRATVLYLAKRLRRAESESHGRLVTLERLVGVTHEDRAAALKRRADHGEPSGEWVRPAVGGGA
jgi:hypothetical protein